MTTSLNPLHFTIQPLQGKSPLQLSPLKLHDDYCKKWNVTGSLQDFLCLTRNGQMIRDTIYRKGMMGGDITQDYFLLLKYVEAFYDDTITTDKLRKPHLESRWCILDKNGIERKEFKAFDSPYLVSKSLIYSIDSKYFNIETGELYCYASTSMTSMEYLFLLNQFDKDESKRGVMKINKKDGSYELFPAMR